MSSPSLTPGKVLHRICPSCDSEITEERASCPKCGSKLVEIRDEDNLVGTVLDDRFEIRDKLGQGGMGTVYRAWQRSVGREVAVKLIDRSYSREPMAVRRFLREARLASQLSQPNTVSVFDFGQSGDGRLFIAMELIRGRTLHSIVQSEGAFSIERTKRIGVQICDALEAAHALGIVHRDMKLENVIVLDHPPGRDLLKVLDFGLAKNIRDPGSRATESGIVVGTPRYMAPEAAMSGTALPAGDVYGLGVILGELATGKPLWDGENLPQLIGQKMDPASAIARIPAAIRPVLKAMLDPEPDRRPTAEQARVMLSASSAEPNAGDTVLDPEPDADATTNLRANSDKAAAGHAPTRQLTPKKLDSSDAEVRTSGGAFALAPTITPAQSPPSPSLADLVTPPKNRLPALLAIGGAMVLIVAAVVLYVTTTDEPASQREVIKPAVAVSADAAVPQLAADAAMAVAPSKTVTLKIETSPSGATVEYMGRRHQTPFELEVPRGDKPIELSITRKGYVADKVVIIPDQDQPISRTLKKVRAAAPGDPSIPF